MKGGVQSILGGGYNRCFGGGFLGREGSKHQGQPQSSSTPPNPTPLRDGTPEVVQALCPPPSPKKTPSPSPPPLSTVVIWGGGEKLGLIQGMVGRGGEKKKNPNPKIYQTPKIYPNTKIYPVPSSCPWWGGMAQHRGGHMLPPPPTPSWSLVPSPGWQRVQRAWLAWACGDHAALGGWWWRWGAGHDPIFPPTAVPPSLPSELRGEGAQRGVVGGLGRRLGVVATPCAPPAPCQLRTPPCRRGRSRPAWPRCCCCPAR